MATYKTGRLITVPDGNPMDFTDDMSRAFSIAEYNKAMVTLNEIIGVADVPLNFDATSAMIGAGLIGQAEGVVIAGLEYPLAILQAGTYDPASDSLIYHVCTPRGYITTVVDWTTNDGYMLYRESGDISRTETPKKAYAIACGKGAVNIGAFGCSPVANGITTSTLTGSGDYRPAACIVYGNGGMSGVASAAYDDVAQNYLVTFDRTYTTLPILVSEINAVDGSVASVMLDDPTDVSVRVTLFNDLGQKVRNDDGFSIFGFTNAM